MKTILATMLLSAALCSTAYAEISPQTAVRSTGGRPVGDSSGKCVRTQWLEKVDECTVEKTAQQQVVAMPRTELAAADRTVYFEFDKAELLPEAKARLDTLSATLANAKDVQRTDIVGFADRIGTTGYNEELSKQRAIAVQSYMAQRGYLNTRVVDVRYVGESQSNAPCDDNAAREERIACLSPDRKVEAEIAYIQQAAPSYHYGPTLTNYRLPSNYRR